MRRLSVEDWTKGFPVDALDVCDGESVVSAAAHGTKRVEWSHGGVYIR